jgi:NAD(P)-dependent dehydrogenase (short-subunit alcohol dehydrogenase family)
MEIQDLTAVITGSTGRLGEAIALGLAERGMDCVCHYRVNSQKAQTLVEKIAALGQRAVAVQADLTCEKDIERLFQTAGSLGKVRVLVNSAAVFERQPLAGLTAEIIRQTLSVNLAAPMLTGRFFTELLEAEGLKHKMDSEPFAKIINLVDVAGQKPWAEYAAYCASKAGLIGLTKALAKELAPGITVNAVAPGIIAASAYLDADEEKKQLTRIPAGRFGQPEEVVRAIVFLLKNDYISGQVLAIDGGRSI